jgi:xylitol oxidase
MSRVEPESNWAGNITFGAARVHRPQSIDSLRRIVHGGRHVRALGCGHSFSRVADTSGDFVLLDNLPDTFTVDRNNSTVTVPSWMSYSDLADRLFREGLALSNMASIPDISIAGAFATGTHGSGDAHRVLADSAAAMTMLVADGDQVELRRDLHRQDFPGSVVALGALGIVIELTLDIEPAYEISQQVSFRVPLDEIENGLDGVFGAGYSVSVFTNWLSGEASVWVKRRVDRPVSNWSAGRQAQHMVHPVPGMSPSLCTEQLGTVGPWHERLPHFRPKSAPGSGNELQSEVFLPRRAAQQAISELREIARLFAPVLFVSEMRSVRADGLWLSPAYGQDSVTFHFTWMADEIGALQAIAAIEERLLPLGPRPHWGKLTTMTPERTISSYARAPDFERLMAKYDPTFKFRNDFVNGLFPIR